LFTCAQWGQHGGFGPPWLQMPSNQGIEFRGGVPMPTIIGLAVGDLAVLSILKSTPRSATLTPPCKMLETQNFRERPTHGIFGNFWRQIHSKGVPAVSGTSPHFQRYGEMPTPFGRPLGTGLQSAALCLQRTPSVSNRRQLLQPGRRVGGCAGGKLVLRLHVSSRRGTSLRRLGPGGRLARPPDPAMCGGTWR